MKFELDSQDEGVVHSGGTSRIIRLLLVAAISAAFPIGLWLLFEGSADDPFDSGSDYYPAFLLPIYGGPLLLVGYVFFFLRKGFKHLYIDDADPVMTVRWQGFFQDWKETIRLDSVRSFSVTGITLGEYRRGWELRSQLARGSDLRLAQFENENAAIDAADNANAVVATSRVGD